MLYIRPILLLNLFLCFFSVSALGAQESLPSCLERGKTEFLAQQQKALPRRNYEPARRIFERCLKLDPDNVDTLLSLGGVAMEQNSLSSAQDYFWRAIKNMPRTSPYWSYTYSMLGDIAFKQNRPHDAMKYYEKSLEYNKAYVNSLVGKAVILENLGNVQDAARAYKVALAVEPLNVVARRHLTALEPVYFTDEEMLAALKQRYAVSPDKQTLSDEDRKLFREIHSAEQRGGLEYLKGKYKNPPADYIVTLFKGTDFARDVLTLNGYNALEQQIGQDAVVVFQKMKVPAKDVFKLRDKRGEKIFLPDNTLTDSGFYVYNEALRGRKEFLLPGESVPPTRKELAELSSRVEELYSSGYTEISEAELSFVKKQSNCSEKTLRQDMGLYVLKSGNNTRYFVPAGETADPTKGVAYYYVAHYRARRQPNIRLPRNRMVEEYHSYGFTVCSAVDGSLLLAE